MPVNSSGQEKLFFWLGFLAASLLWFLGIRYRRLFPQLKDFLSNQIKAVRARFTAGVEEMLRQTTLRRALAYHLSAGLFPLDQIAVEPHLLAPPPQVGPKGLVSPRKYYPQVLGYLPEVPLFAAHYGAPRLTIAQALQAEVNIAILGEPGAGKSFALAYLAVLIARRDPRAGAVARLFPLFLHANDLLPFIRTIPEPEEVLLKALQFHAPHTRAALLKQFLRGRLDTGSAILLLDGLDELSPPEFERACIFIAALLGKYPELRLVTTAAPQNSRRMLELGIEPIALAGWNLQETQGFIRTWARQWNISLSNWGEDRGFPPLDDLLLSSWLTNSSIFHSPSEWTLKVWAACAGNLEGSGSLAAVKAYLQRELANVSCDGLPNLADEMIIQQASALPRDHVERLISMGSQEAHGKASSDRLVEKNLLRRHAGGRLAFSSPWLTGFFASQAGLNQLEPPDLDWPAARSKTAFSLAQQTPAWLTKFFQAEHPPLFTNLIQASAWLRFIPQNHDSKTHILRRLLPLIQREDLPACVRMSLVGNIATCNDPSMAALFKQWLNSNSLRVRQLAVLGLGACRDVKPVSEIYSRLEDPSAEVRFAACFALSALNSQDALDGLVEYLEQGDEETKRVVAEVLAVSSTGRELLKPAVSSEDLLVRRATVYGLSLITEPWVYSLLEKVAIEDTHWVVRNAAVIALEEGRADNPYLPRPRLAPSETPWLIEFAARSGRSVSRQESPVPILRQVFQSGSIEEQISALWMIRYLPADPQLLADAWGFLLHENIDLRETAHYVLWQLQAAV
jgi:HEAT repeat protein